jgi:hypothetical protein
MKREFLIKKYIWDEDDYDELTWHDNRIYAIIFDPKKYGLTFDLDHILKWEEDWSGYWLSPALLSFENVNDVIINLDFKDTTDFIIESIDKGETRLTKNELLSEARYNINTDVGNICFFATGFKMNVLKEPIWSTQQDLDRHVR